MLSRGRAHQARVSGGLANPRSSSRMGRRWRSALISPEPLDPRSPSNVAISGLTLLAAAAAGVIALTPGPHPVASDPRCRSDLPHLGPRAGARPRPRVDRLDCRAPGRCPGSTRLRCQHPGDGHRADDCPAGRGESTGRRPLPTDLAAMVVLAGAVSFTALGWVVRIRAGGCDLSRRSNGRRHTPGERSSPPSAPRSAPSLVATLTDALPQALPEVRPLLTLALGAPRPVRGASGPARSDLVRRLTAQDPARPDRLHAGRTMVGLVALLRSLAESEAADIAARADRGLRPGAVALGVARNASDGRSSDSVGGRYRFATCADQSRCSERARSPRPARRSRQPPSSSSARSPASAKPAAHNADAFDHAVHEIAHASQELLESLEIRGARAS